MEWVDERRDDPEKWSGTFAMPDGSEATVRILERAERGIFDYHLAWTTGARSYRLSGNAHDLGQSKRMVEYHLLVWQQVVLNITPAKRRSAHADTRGSPP